MKKNPGPCSVDGCEQFESARGLCMKHYQRQRKRGTTADPVKPDRGACSVEGCESPPGELRLCRRHYQRRRYRDRRLAAGHNTPLPEVRPCAICGTEFHGVRRQLYCGPTCSRAARLAAQHLRDYGIAGNVYPDLLAAQGRVCAICKQEDRSPNRSLSVDHDHVTNAVRGLLCHHCNVGVGHFYDDPALLRAAAEYLEAAKRKV